MLSMKTTTLNSKVKLYRLNVDFIAAELRQRTSIMSENVFAPSADETRSFKSSRALKTIVYGPLVVGVLDGLWAVILSGLQSLNGSC